MRMGRRLFLAVLPAVLGLLAMAGLAWWGRSPVPGWVPPAGVLAALASLGMAWRSTRYVARRMEALSRRRAPPAGADRPVGRSPLAEARAREAEALAGEYAGLLADVSATGGRRLEEVRMPLHILLASPFGELNENQEELIAAAQRAAEEADGALRMVGRIAELDAGRVERHPEPLRPRDLLAPVLAAAGPAMERARGTLHADLSPALPRVHVDPRQVREALSLVLHRVAAGAAPGDAARLTAEARGGAVHLRIEAASLRADEAFPLAGRLLRLQGGSLAVPRDGAVEIALPAAASPV